MKMEWISVEERFLDEYQEVLYFCLDETGHKEIMTGHREKLIWTHCCCFYSTMRLNDLVKITHWIPLPEPPK